MTTVLAIIMSIMILFLALLLAGVAVLALDNIKERDQLRVIRDELESRDSLAHRELERQDDQDLMQRYNNIVNRHL